MTYPSQHNLSTCIRISTPLPPTGTAATHPAGPRRQTSVRREAYPPAHVLPPAAALCAGGRRPAREIATRELRSECSISRPALALPPSTGTAATSTQQASRHPPVGRPPTPQRQSPQARVPLPLAPPPAPATLTTAGNTPDEIGK